MLKATERKVKEATESLLEAVEEDISDKEKELEALYKKRTAIQKMLEK